MARDTQRRRAEMGCPWSKLPRNPTPMVRPVSNPASRMSPPRTPRARARRRLEDRPSVALPGTAPLNRAAWTRARSPRSRSEERGPDSVTPRRHRRVALQLPGRRTLQQSRVVLDSATPSTRRHDHQGWQPAARTSSMYSTAGAPQNQNMWSTPGSGAMEARAINILYKPCMTLPVL